MTYNQSLAEKFLEETPNEDDQYQWIIVYDFIQEKPNPRFWKNLEKLMRVSTVSRIQYSVLIAEKKGDALAAEKLGIHYGAMVEVFKCVHVGGGS